jgi:hypothetical protein
MRNNLTPKYGLFREKIWVLLCRLVNNNIKDLGTLFAVEDNSVTWMHQLPFSCQSLNLKEKQYVGVSVHKDHIFQTWCFHRSFK